MSARIIISGSNNQFPRDAAQSCGAYLNQMPRPVRPWGLEAAARSVVLPTRERAALIAAAPNCHRTVRVLGDRQDRAAANQSSPPARRLPARGNLASSLRWDEAPSYDATAERWIRRPSTTMVDADAVADPRHFVAKVNRNPKVHTVPPQTDRESPADGSNHAAGLAYHFVEVATVIGGMTVFGAIAFCVMLLA